MTNIDARGKNCPIPVIMTKKVIAEGEKEITVLVDNKTATLNLEKLAQNSGMSFSCKAIGSDFEVTLSGEGKAEAVIETLTLDAVGKACPTPVIMAKNALLEGVKELTVLVDNKIAVQNLTKLGENNGKTVTVSEENGIYSVVLGGEGKAIDEKPAGDWAVFVTEKGIGVTDNELGGNLLKMYIYTLTQAEDLPGAMIFMNEGVKVLENEEIQISLSELAIKGVKLVFCGTCLNFYGISHLCAPQNVSNMYDIVEEMAKYNKVVKL